MTDLAQLPFKERKLGDPPSQGIDAWHYTGNANFHKKPEHRAFIERCQQALTKRDLPIVVGRTGYVELASVTPLAEIPPGWCYDHLGRTVIIFGGYLIFQRYTEGDLLISCDYTGQHVELSTERMAELASKL